MGENGGVPHPHGMSSDGPKMVRRDSQLWSSNSFMLEYNYAGILFKDTFQLAFLICVSFLIGYFSLFVSVVLLSES